MNLNGNRQVVDFTMGGGIGSGAFDFAMTRASAITGGVQSGAGTTVLGGASTVFSSGLGLDGGRVLRIDNVLTWTGGQINLNANTATGSGTIRTAVDGSFVAEGDSTSDIFTQNQGGTDTGVTAAAGRSDDGGRDLQQRRSAGVQTGILSLTGSGTHKGSFNIDAGSELRFGGGTHTLTGGTATGLAISPSPPGS